MCVGGEGRGRGNGRGRTTADASFDVIFVVLPMSHAISVIGRGAASKDGVILDLRLLEGRACCACWVLLRPSTGGPDSVRWLCSIGNPRA